MAVAAAAVAMVTAAAASAAASALIGMEVVTAAAMDVAMAAVAATRMAAQLPRCSHTSHPPPVSGIQIVYFRPSRPLV